MKSLLVIAGLDPSGGAGVVADVRLAEHQGVRALAVVTALTVQDTSGVRAVHSLPGELIADQLSALLSDIEVAAVKIGMLGTEEVARAVAAGLALTAAPVVWDPVWAPTSDGTTAREDGGSIRLLTGSLAAVAELLARHVTVATPNVPEAAALCGFDVRTVADARRAAGAIADRMECAVVVKGGHLPPPPAKPGATPAIGGGDDRAPRPVGSIVDVLCERGECVEIDAPRVELVQPVHGTGCAFSTALACELAAGRAIEAAVRTAGQVVRARLSDPARFGRGHPSVM